MRVFNAFQIACLFTAMPFIIDWLSKGTFSGSAPLWWVAVVVYVILFIATTAAWRSLIHDIDGK